MSCGSDALCLSAELFVSMSIVIIVARTIGMLFRSLKQASTSSYSEMDQLLFQNYTFHENFAFY